MNKEIFIWDNGGCYSAQTIWFVESDLPRAVVERTLFAVTSTQHEDYRGRLIGVVYEAAWTSHSFSPLRNLVDSEGDHHETVWSEEFHGPLSTCPLGHDRRPAHVRETAPRQEFPSDEMWRKAMVKDCLCPKMMNVREALK